MPYEILNMIANAARMELMFWKYVYFCLRTLRSSGGGHLWGEARKHVFLLQGMTRKKCICIFIGAKETSLGKIWKASALSGSIVYVHEKCGVSFSRKDW